MYKSIFKTVIDFITALLLTFCLSPVFLIFTLLLFINNSGTPFFVQRRTGRWGKVFNIVKFKTMTDKCDADGKLLPDSHRITKFGSFIRRSSVDEIPQLLNVIIGDMSLIGPRPLLPEYLTLYSKEQFRRHEVKPGITGWAQVNGRNAINWDLKFKLDVWYVDNISFWLDLRIVLFTIKKVIVKDGISSDTSVTMEKFKGN